MIGRPSSSVKHVDDAHISKSISYSHMKTFKGTDPKSKSNNKKYAYLFLLPPHGFQIFSCSPSARRRIKQNCRPSFVACTQDGPMPVHIGYTLSGIAEALLSEPKYPFPLTQIQPLTPVFSTYS